MKSCRSVLQWAEPSPSEVRVLHAVTVTLLCTEPISHMMCPAGNDPAPQQQAQQHAPQEQQEQQQQQPVYQQYEEAPVVQDVMNVNAIFDVLDHSGRVLSIQGAPVN